MESEGIMKAYFKIGLTAMLLASFVLLSGFRAQTIIHDDGSETQDVLKVSDTAQGQKDLRSDADEFQQRNYTIMDYNNNNGIGFRAMKTITKEGANRSSVDRIVHKTHDGLICSTYYIDYQYNADSMKALRLGIPMMENGVDLEYIVSFPSGTRVVSNSTKADDQGSTYMWRLNNSDPAEIKLQATVWHKLFIYMALFFIVIVLLIILFMEHRRKNVISWKRAAHMRRIEMMLLCIPILLLGYMGYEYYVGTHITAETLAKVSEQQQEELLENREEDKRIHDADAKKQRNDELAASRIRSTTIEISSSLRELNREYVSGQISQSAARTAASKLAAQAQDLLRSNKELSQADRDVLQQLVDRLVEEADSIGSGSTVSKGVADSSASEEQRRADALSADQAKSSAAKDEPRPTSNEADRVNGDDASAGSAKAADTSKDINAGSDKSKNSK
ncbi:hypothetical protein [Megasphaera cerevisiae]|uniref:hypothetical protein n=2 Tax=Megasphaera cerevisiae TaxID=39029 RepID=UPI0009081F60|nr:hypothetical protein [Megasphaera cerevisiae]